MPTIEISYKDLCNLVGKKMSIEKLKDEYMLYAKAEIEEVDGDRLKLDVKDTNRPELWSVEGIAREIEGRVGTKRGLPTYEIGKSGIVVEVDKKNRNVRPYTVCAVVRGLKITEEVLFQIIQLQEKICGTFGRNRQEVALGIYDLHKIVSPIKFTTYKPDELKFVPLEFEDELTLDEILEIHPKGKEYGHLLEGMEEYPIFIDSEGNVLSMPPIINSNHTGKVTEKTKDIFIECSGFDFKFLMPALNMMVVALADRGAKIESVEVRYPEVVYNKKKTLDTPDMTPKKMTIDVDFVNKLSGIELTTSEVSELLEQARYFTEVKKDKIEATYPAYRQDIMHPRDVAEDAIISYGFNNIEPEVPKLATIGSMAEKEKLSNDIADVAVGLGMQEVLSYTLTNKENLFDKMNIKEEIIAELENPVSVNWNVFRSWVLPSVMEFLSNNQHVVYPQVVFEIGDAIVLDEKMETKTRDVRKMAAAIAGTNANYDTISAKLDGVFRTLGVSYKLKKSKHGSFIQGRTANVIVNGEKIGFIGEINPKVLESWKIEMPVAAFEIGIESL